jgi:mRNA-degrading endonuclease toxin of MazEF toxin-antitoxin module
VARLRFGQVIFASLDDGRGTFKIRPAVIISDDAECADGGAIQVVCITKSFESPWPAYHHRVHDSYHRDPDTGLEFPCVAKCNWVREIMPSDVINRVGDLPDAMAAAILESVHRLLDDTTFVEWQ